MNRVIKKLLCIFISVGIIMSCFSIFAFAETGNKVLADWRFEQSSIESGELKKNNLVIKDSSGNGNSLEFNGHRGEKYFSFSDEKMYNGTTGSLEFNNPTYSFVNGGANFITSHDAPINKEQFKNGYTIEFIYQLPADFANNDSWMGLMARKGKSNSMTDKAGVTACLSVSNCKELQFITANANNNHKMDSAWSVSMDKGGVWYHIAVTSDNHVIRTFVNGCEAFRDYVNDEMIGMYADPNDGRFVIGGFDNGIMEHLGRGKYQQVRISSGALDKSQWLVPNPEALLGKYGINQEFVITAGGNYNMVFLPDIQNSIEFTTDVVDTSVKWLVNNREKANISAILSLGDNINTYSDPVQWSNANKVISQIANTDIPFIEMPGNHDYGETYYLDTFGPNSEFGKKMISNFVSYSPSGYGSYRTFEAGSYKYLMVAYSMYHTEDRTELAWLEKVLTDNKDLPTLFISHDMQNCDASSPSKVHLSDNGELLWKVLKKYNQVFMMVGGHSHGAGEQILTNDSGNPVISILADYQFAYNGGNGFFKFAEFDEAHKKILLSTFSPYASQLTENQRTFFDVNYMTGPGNYSEFDIDFTKRFDGLTKSSKASEHAEIIEIVNQLDSLKLGVKSNDLERIHLLANTVKNLPANVQATFSDLAVIDAAKAIATDLKQRGSDETVVPVFDQIKSELSVVSDNSVTIKSERTKLELMDVIIIIASIASTFLLIIIAGTVTFIVLRKKKKRTNQ